MSDELVKMEVPTGSLIPSMAPALPDKTFDDLATAGKFLPRLALCGSNSDFTKTGQVPMGSYAIISGKTVTPLGNEVDVLVISWRPTALDMRSEDTPISSHDTSSEVFKSIANRAENESDSGCAYGPEFLLYVPSAKKYVTFLMGSKSLRREAPVLKGKISNAATLKVDLASNQRYKWHVTVVFGCSTPFEIPPYEEIKEKADNFNNPPVEALREKVEAKSGRSR